MDVGVGDVPKDGVTDWVGAGLLDTLGLPDTLALRLVEAVREAEKDTDRDGLRDGEGDGELEVEVEGDREGVGDPDQLGVGDAVPVGDVGDGSVEGV